MNSLKPLWVIGLCCLLGINSSAQTTIPFNQVLPVKPALFSSLPEKFTTSIYFIEKLFSEQPGKAIKIPLPGNSYFEGVITEKVQKNPNVACINIRASNFDGALFTLSKIINKDLSVSYIGRIVSIRYGDLFMLTIDNNQVSFTKLKQSLMLVE